MESNNKYMLVYNFDLLVLIVMSTDKVILEEISKGIKPCDPPIGYGLCFLLSGLVDLTGWSISLVSTFNEFNSS